MFYSKVCLHTFAYVLPPRILSSDDIEERLAPLYQRLKLPAGRLELMSGIKERRLWEPGTRPSQGAALAGQAALDKDDIDPESVECLIFTSVSRDMMEPATASFVHNQLGLSEDCLLFDLSNACLGFLDGMVMLANMIELGHVRNGLVVAGETAEELVESTIQTLLTDERQNKGSRFARNQYSQGFRIKPLPDESVYLTNTLCSVYKNSDVQRKSEKYIQANGFVGDMLHEQQKKLATADRALSVFMTKNEFMK